MDHHTPYFVRPVDDNLFLENKNKTISDKLIEIIPHNKQFFEFISFVEFSNITNFDYKPGEKTVTKNKTLIIELYNVKPLHPIPIGRLKYTFKVEIGHEFSYIKIFMKNYINDFTSIIKNGKLFIKIADFQIHTQNIMDNFHLIDKRSMLLDIANYYYHHKCPDCIKYFFLNYLNKQNEEEIKKRNNMSITEILDICPGFIKVIFQRDDEIKYISIVFPWSLDLIKDFQYIELDASFTAIKPYAFCVAQGIIFNESIPYAITVAPSESLELYDMIFEHSEEISKEQINWKSIPLLSDMHKSLIAVGKKYGLTHFFCHRHLIEHFGSSSVLGLICKRILSCYTFEEYDQICFEIPTLLECYIEERIAIGNCSKDFIDKVNDLNIMLSGDKADIDSIFHYMKWAIWIRADYHVGRCSNHNESLHSVINKSLGQCYSIKSKLNNLIISTLKHFTKLKNRKGKSIIRKYNALITILKNKLKNPKFDILTFCSEECKCGKTKYNDMIYGFPIPCEHCIFYPAKEVIQNIILKLEKEENGITINRLVSLILLYKSNKRKIPENPEKLIQDIFGPKILPTIQLDFDELIELINGIMHCFDCDFPDLPNVDVNWDIHELSTINLKKPNSIFDEDLTPPPANHSFFSSFENEIIFQNYIVGQKGYEKKVLFETIKEILTVYPEIENTSAAYELCIDEFINYFVNSNSEDELKSIANFKISCWKAADLMMKKNKFFK